MNENYIDIIGNKKFFSLKKFALQNDVDLDYLPISIRIIIESLIRNDVDLDLIKALAAWNPSTSNYISVPFFPSRVILQDYTAVPILTDLALLKSTCSRYDINKALEPKIPVDLVIDHSLHANHIKSIDAAELNIKEEFQQNNERYKFIKWASHNIKNLRVFPPGNGIVHQINIEYISKVVMSQNNTCFFDTVIGADSHSTMVNGLGILGWGVGGIDAEMAMLGLPINIQIPDIIGVKLVNHLSEGVTTTDLVLHLTHFLREENVVGKFLEFYGEGIKYLTIPERATIANMAPDYGATLSLFPVDEITLNYLRNTNREQDNLVKKYFQAQNMLGDAINYNKINYSQKYVIDLSKVSPCIAGPYKPQQKIELTELKSKLQDFNIYNNEKILIASITSCTNTSNPSVIIAAALLAKNATERGLKVPQYVHTSFAPGSKVVAKYLQETGLQKFLDNLGFNIVGYGCTTCVGNIGKLDKTIEQQLINSELLGVSVLSGNRNFESRIHPLIKANFLMSPPLVVAFALAGFININILEDPLGIDKDGKNIFLRDIWPSNDELANYINKAHNPNHYKNAYNNLSNELWDALEVENSEIFKWENGSTYLVEPPFLDDFIFELKEKKDLKHAKPILVLGDSITTDHISPAGVINKNSPAGTFLISKNIEEQEFNTYGTRRGNHEIMVRGAFSNPALVNYLSKNENFALNKTIHYPSFQELDIFDAAMRYKNDRRDVILIAGKEYGTGSSRDWAAKATKLLGVKVVIAQSFEKIHRSNLVGMGILPCEFIHDIDIKQFTIRDEFFIHNINKINKPKSTIVLEVKKSNNEMFNIPLLVRLDNELELIYFIHGGILPYFIREQGRLRCV